MKRLFIAIPLAEPIKDVLGKNRPVLSGMRWIARGNLHLTLCFLGEVPESAQRRLEHELAAMDASPFMLEVQGIGTFGGQAPRVLWAGIGRGGSDLVALQRQVSTAVKCAGLQQSSQKYAPHITLARLRGVQAADLAPYLESVQYTSFGLMPVREMVMYASELRPEGAVYTVEYCRTLG